MTMHLVGPYMTTTNYKKKKRSKITAGKMKAYETDLRAYNKNMKRIGSHNMQMTMDEYIDYRQGNYKPKVNPNYRPPAYEPPQTRETPDYPSLSNNIGGVATKKEVPVYTGNAVIGQAYNKGGLQVLSSQEANDPMTGKRR